MNCFPFFSSTIIRLFLESFNKSIGLFASITLEIIVSYIKVCISLFLFRKEKPLGKENRFLNLGEITLTWHEQRQEARGKLLAGDTGITGKRNLMN